jgi:hypothetical protein
MNKIKIYRVGKHTRLHSEGRCRDILRLMEKKCKAAGQGIYSTVFRTIIRGMEKI